jgi:GxxExxY protein
LRLLHEDVCERVIGAAIEVHRYLGPGLLESAYRVCMAHELRQRGGHVLTEVPMPVEYKGVRLDVGYRLDMLIDERVVVEVKAVKDLLPIHQAQLLSYLKLSGLRVGLLLNFHVPVLTSGIKRIVL